MIPMFDKTISLNGRSSLTAPGYDNLIIPIFDSEPGISHI